MKENLTEIVAILDRSGSMSGLDKDTIGGYNAFIDQQKQVPGEAVLTTVLFDDQYDLLHDGVNIKEVLPITGREYFPRGTTALLDAVGNSISTIGEKLSKMSESDRPGKVMFLIITDGAENSSKEYTQAQIKEMVERQQNIYKWEFLFFGANIDSFAAAGGIGISHARSANFTASAHGVSTTMDAMSFAATSYRKTGAVDNNYSKGIK
jgi:uncharacterized protein YegL